MSKVLLITNILLAGLLVAVVLGFVTSLWKFDKEIPMMFQLVQVQTDGPVLLSDMCEDIDESCYLYGNYDQELIGYEEDVTSAPLEYVGDVTEILILRKNGDEKEETILVGKEYDVKSEFCESIKEFDDDGRFKDNTFGSEFGFICDEFIGNL